MDLTFDIGPDLNAVLREAFGLTKPRLTISKLTIGQLSYTGELMAFQLRDDQTASATVTAKDARGNLAEIQAPAWASSDEGIITVEPSADGLSATITPTGPLGTAQVQFSADADLGEGVVTLSGAADVEVVGGEASSVEITLTTNGG